MLFTQIADQLDDAGCRADHHKDEVQKVRAEQPVQTVAHAVTDKGRDRQHHRQPEILADILVVVIIHGGVGLWPALLSVLHLNAVA